MTQNSNFRSRKRTRNQQEEVEFMPLSKRINNLHINNSLLFENQASSTQNSIQLGPEPPNGCFNLPDSPQSLEWSNAVPNYSPELSETQNPHYFNINKLLFEMYIERLHRESR
ncbi:hypothetical protein WA026_000544 [Henosepilachna vigintioctopunctata]|uniref:Uncharacterized protein n=1 Tax=Henosepilachna vigintioctopunctata TaxID=420089 RepID=A0AAW1UXW8_9CUCU